MTDREIYEELRGPLMRFAASLVGAQDAPDLVSEAVLSALRRGPLSSLDNPKAYLMQATVNRARSRGRSLQRERRALSRLGASGSVDGTPFVDPDLLETVAGLPPRQRAAIHLVYWEDLDTVAAARLLGVRPSTLRRYLHLARRRLGRYLDE